MICDQAIFTSIRTPMGQGYRLIAASSGLHADERAEITRRSPSHGSLCDSRESAVGLDSYRLDDGRRCVTYTAYAGTEQTARGGERVYTQIALLQAKDFRKLDADPLCAHRVLGQIFKEQGPLLKPPLRLEQLSLPITDPTHSAPEQVNCPPLEANISAWLWPTAAELLKGGRLVLVGLDQPLELARWILLCLPLKMREQIDVTVGLKPSATRLAHLCITPLLDSRSQQFIEGQEIPLWDRTHHPPPGVEPFTTWFDLLRKWWNEGRGHELADFTSQVCAQASPDDLNRLAAERQAQEAEALQAEASARDHQPATPARDLRETSKRYRNTASGEAKRNPG